MNVDDDRVNGFSNGPIAQLVEHRADNAGVSGSIPLRPIMRIRSTGP